MNTLIPLDKFSNILKIVEDSAYLNSFRNKLKYLPEDEIESHTDYDEEEESEDEIEERSFTPMTSSQAFTP